MTTIAEEIAKGLSMIHEGKLVELRALGIPTRGRKAIWSGYFLDYAKAATCALEAEEAGAEGIYQTLQDVHPGCYARAPDRWVRSPQHTTTDKDVIATPWLLVDIDPVRPSGISSSETELAAAGKVAEDIIDTYFCTGPLITAYSGNGYHLITRFEDWDGKEFLARLDRQFGTEQVSIDQSVTKRAQLTKLYGTLTRKGFATPDRPHRRSTIFYKGPR